MFNKERRFCQKIGFEIVDADVEELLALVHSQKIAA
jgi:hypothetical protein